MFPRAFSILFLALCPSAWGTSPAISFPMTLTTGETAALASEACLAPFGTNLEKAEVTSRWGSWEAERQANDHQATVTCAAAGTRDDTTFRRTAQCSWKPARWTCEWKDTLVDLTVEG